MCVKGKKKEEGQINEGEWKEKWLRRKGECSKRYEIVWKEGKHQEWKLNKI